MANNVKVIVLGGETKTMDGVRTVADVKERTNTQTYTAAVQGNPSSDGQALRDGDTVTLSMQQKGGLS